MFTKRIIPCLDVKNGRVVKGVNFVNLRDAGDPVEIAAAYDKAGADEVIFLDITATSDARATVVDMVRKVAENVSSLLLMRGAEKMVPVGISIRMAAAWTWELMLWNGQRKQISSVLVRYC